MRSTLLLSALVLFWCGSATQAEDTTAKQREAAKWAEEDARDARFLGQTENAVSAIGRIVLTQREWSSKDLEGIQQHDAGVFTATHLFREQGWKKLSAVFQVRLADKSVLNWLLKKPTTQPIQVKGRLRVDGKYLLIENCRPAERQPEVAPPSKRSKRGGL